MTSIGFEGWMLGTLTAGAKPEPDFLQAVAQVRGHLTTKNLSKNTFCLDYAWRPTARRDARLPWHVQPHCAQVPPCEEGEIAVRSLCCWYCCCFRK